MSDLPEGGAGLDLDAYFARIGYDGPRDATLSTLFALHALHSAAIPFENIDVQLGREIRLDLASLQAKLIAARRGGYCVEQNRLFKAVLEALGFSVSGYLARVFWRIPPPVRERPRTHMALRVTIDGEPWHVDVGFGGCAQTAPLRLIPDLVQTLTHGAFRFTPRSDGELTLEHDDEGWDEVYRLAAHPALDIDYDVTNWFTSAHPASPFKAFLMAARHAPDARYSLFQNRLTVRPVDGEPRRESLDADGLALCLERDFGLRPEPSWRPMLERAVAAGST
jgi:N-hydroxyarylamine O-acetyltransferase